MKNALIDPREGVTKIVGWVPNTTPPQAILEPIPNAARVAQVEESTFPVAEPLFWTPCADDVVADQWYYDTVQQVCIAVPPIPPAPSQPSSTGTQTL
jgi:hypothetical protein